MPSGADVLQYFLHICIIEEIGTRSRIRTGDSLGENQEPYTAWPCELGTQGGNRTHNPGGISF